MCVLRHSCSVLLVCLYLSSLSFTSFFLLHVHSTRHLLYPSRAFVPVHVVSHFIYRTASAFHDMLALSCLSVCFGARYISYFFAVLRAHSTAHLLDPARVLFLLLVKPHFVTVLHVYSTTHLLQPAYVFVLLCIIIHFVCCIAYAFHDTLALCVCAPYTSFCLLYCTCTLRYTCSILLM